MPDDAEKRLLERLRMRDEAAFNELVRRHEGRVFRLLVRMLGDRAEAEDLAQEVFITVFKSIETFRGDSELGTWIYRIAANHSKNRVKYLGRRARSAQRTFDEIDPAHAGGEALAAEKIARPDELAQGHEVEGMLKRALAALDPEQREVLVLRDLENLTYEEIQTITGLAEGTVKSRLHRARLSLGERMRTMREGDE